MGDYVVGGVSLLPDCFVIRSYQNSLRRVRFRAMASEQPFRAIDYSVFLQYGHDSLHLHDINFHFLDHSTNNWASYIQGIRRTRNEPTISKRWLHNFLEGKEGLYH